MEQIILEDPLPSKWHNFIWMKKEVLGNILPPHPHQHVTSVKKTQNKIYADNPKPSKLQKTAQSGPKSHNL